jgi:phosphatidylglycerol:prolipoprotein diacylglycerol transferase
MIVLPFDPIAVQVGPLVLTWHGIFSALGILVGLWLAARLAPAAGVAPETIWGAAWWVIGLGLLGARLLFAAEHPQVFLGQPWRLILVNEGGISVFGAVLGGMAGGAVAARRAGVAPARLLDAAAPGFLLGQAIGRIGDVINGEHLGAHAPGLPWAVVYTHPNTLGEIGVAVHPAVAYELLWDLAAAGVVVWLLRRRRSSPGAALWAGLLLYGLGRLWVGFFRLHPRVAFGLGLAQLIGLAVLPVALAGLWRTARAGRHPPH